MSTIGQRSDVRDPFAGSSGLEKHSASPLIYLPLFLAFIPFFSPYPINTDVQPLFFLFALLPIFAHNKTNTVNFCDLLFALMIVLSLTYTSSLSEWSPLSAIRFAFAFIAYYFFRQFLRFLNEKILLLGMIVHTSMIAFNFFAPRAFIDSAGLFVRAIKVEEIGVRGASGLAAEPGFAGTMSVVMLAVSMLLRDFAGKERYYRIIFILCVAGVIMTRSGTGMLLFLIVAFAYYFKWRIKYMSILAVITSVTIWAVYNIDMGRASSALVMLFNNPKMALLLDPSMGTRVLNFFIGVVSIFENPLGKGVNAYDYVSWQIANKYNISAMISGKVGTNSALATYSVEFGLVFWLFIAVFFWNGIRRYGSASFVYLFLSLYFISTTFSLVFPPTWLFISAMHIPERHWKAVLR